MAALDNKFEWEIRRPEWEHAGYTPPDEMAKVDLEDLPTIEGNSIEYDGSLAVIIKDQVPVTRYIDPSSTQLHLNGLLEEGTAIWCQETENFEGIERTRITTPCDGWIDTSALEYGQVCMINSAVGATVRSGIELDTDVVGEIEYETRVFLVEKAETADGSKKRARLVSPMRGWISIKCLIPILDRTGNIVAAGKSVISDKDVGNKGLLYTHFVEINHDQLYKALYDTGLQYGPSFRLCKRAWRTDGEAYGLIGPCNQQLQGWLVHPALADSMLHLTAVAPKPPEGGWPWNTLEEEEQLENEINEAISKGQEPA